LLEATQKELEKIQTSVASGRLTGRAKIGVRVGRVVNKYKVAKHVVLDIEENDFKFSVRDDQIAASGAVNPIVKGVAGMPSSPSECLISLEAACATHSPATAAVRGVIPSADSNIRAL
jgi:hypothetical protein